MGAALGPFVLFPAQESTYEASHHKLVWIKAPCDSISKVADKKDHSLAFLPTDGELAIPLLLLRKKEESRHLILYFHGNSCDLGEIEAELELMQETLECHVVAMEFPGYGVCRPFSTPDPEKINEWCLTTFEWLQSINVRPSSVIIFGRSIGTGPATRLARTLLERDIRVAGLVLHSPYISVHKIIVDYFKYGTYVIQNYWDLSEDLKKLQKTCPLLIIHGQNDEVIPFVHGHTLFNEYRASDNLKQSFFPEDSQHNAYSVYEHIVTPMKEFLEKRSMSRDGPKYYPTIDEAFSDTPLKYRDPNDEEEDSARNVSQSLPPRSLSQAGPASFHSGVRPN
eukprot:Lankesteria_metandrocarpae@DN2523_c0_g1_i2.p1